MRSQVHGHDGQLGMPALELVVQQKIGELGTAVGQELLVGDLHVEVVHVEGDASAAEEGCAVAFGVDVDDATRSGPQES